MEEDYSNLSDEELIKAYQDSLSASPQRQTATEPPVQGESMPVQPDYDRMSDEELISAYQASLLEPQQAQVEAAAPDVVAPPQGLASGNAARTDRRLVGNAGTPMRPEDFADEPAMGGVELQRLRDQAAGAPVAAPSDGSFTGWLRNLGGVFAHNTSGRVAERNIEMNTQDILRGTVRKDGKDVPLTELPDSELDYLVDAAGWNGAGAWFKRFLGPWARSDSGMMQEWDRTEGAKIADPSARKAARVRYAQEMARNITLQNERDKQAAQAEIEGREKEWQSGLTAGLAQTGSYMFPFLAPHVGAVLAGVIGGADRGQEMASDRYEMDEDGNVYVAAERDSTGTAIAKGVARGIVEPLVEKVGGAAATKALGGLAGATLGRIPLVKSVGGKIAGTAAGKALSKYGKTMDRLGKMIGLQGAPEEAIEEFEDSIIDAALGIDRRESEKRGGALQRAGEAAKDFFKPESLKNLAESMLLVQILGGGIAHVGDRYRSKPIDNILSESAGIDKTVLRDYTADEKWAAYEAYVNGLTEEQVRKKLGKGADAVNELTDVIAKGTAEVDDFRDAAYAMMDEGGAKQESGLADAQMRQADARKERQYAEDMAAPFARADAEEAEMGARIERQGEAMRRNAAATQEQSDYDRMMEAREEARAQNRAGDAVEGAGARGTERTGEETGAAADAPERAESGDLAEGAEPPAEEPPMAERPNRLRRQQPNNFRHPGDNRLRPAVPDIDQQPIRETKDETGNVRDEAPEEPAAQDAGRDGQQPPPEAGARPVEGAAPGAEAQDAGVVATGKEKISPNLTGKTAEAENPVTEATENVASLTDTRVVEPSAERKPKGRRGENLRGYTYEDYGAPPNTDAATAGTEPGGTGDEIGASLLRYVKENGRLLYIPQSKDDPLWDWYQSFNDGNARKKRRGDFIALFGMNPRKGRNDNFIEEMSDPALSAYLKGLAERQGVEAVPEMLLESRRKYGEWAAKKRAAAKEAKRGGTSEDDVGEAVSLDEIAARDAADAEYDNAFAEVERYEADSPVIRNFSQEQMRTLKRGDVLRFDHADASWDVVDYDVENDIVTVVPGGALGNPLMSEREIASEMVQYRISADGIQEIKPEKGSENGRENERGASEVVAGDAQGAPARTGADAQGGAGQQAPAGAEGGFALESATAEELKAEQERNRQRAEIKKRQEAPLKGGGVEAGQSLLDLGGTEGEDLFNRTQRAETAPASAQERIAKSYADYVEEPVPEWAKQLSAKDAEEYARLLEDAQARGAEDDGGDALDALEAFERAHDNRLRPAKDARGTRGKGSSSARSAEGATTPPDGSDAPQGWKSASGATPAEWPKGWEHGKSLDGYAKATDADVSALKPGDEVAVAHISGGGSRAKQAIFAKVRSVGKEYDGNDNADVFIGDYKDGWGYDQDARFKKSEIIGIRRVAANPAPAAPTPEMRRKATAAMRILGADAGKDAAALEAELRRMEERGQAASGPGRRKAEALRDLAAYKRAVGAKEVSAEEIAEGRQRDAEQRIIDGEGDTLPSEDFYGRRQSRGKGEMPAKWTDAAKRPLERVARALRNVVTISGKRLKVVFADRPADIGGQTRKSIGGIFTGSTADYANRSRQGGVDDGPSLKKIGTGEGSQVYGWGLYGSTVRGVAEHYANRRNLIEDLADAVLEKASGSNEIALDDLRADKRLPREDRFLKMSDEEIDIVEKYIKGEDISKYETGSLYEQTFFTDRAPGDESHLLKWYGKVPKKQKALIKAQAEKEGINVSNLIWDGGEIQGAMLYNYLATPSYLGSPQAASEFLARSGIDGVKYPVDSYGGKTVKDGDEAGWNYVSFRDDNIRVDHKWTDGELRYMRNGDGVAVGEYDAARGEIRLYPGATVADVVHEFTHPLVDFARAEAEAGRGELLGKIKEIIDAERATWEDPVREAYADKGEGEILEEIFTHAMGDKGADLFGKSTTTLEGRRWYNRLWDAIKGLWRDFATKMGWNRADLRGLDEMSPEDAAQKILSEMAKGRSFGDAVTGGEGTRNAAAEEAVAKAKESGRPVVYTAEDGRKVVAVGAVKPHINNGHKLKTAIKQVKEWLKQYAGSKVKIAETNDEILFIGNKLQKYRGPDFKRNAEVKTAILPYLKEIVASATNPRHEEQRHKHPNTVDFTRYDSSVTIGNADGTVSRYDVDVVVGNRTDGTHYFYDINNIKTHEASSTQQRNAKRGKEKMPQTPRNVPQSTGGVKGVSAEEDIRYSRRVTSRSVPPAPTNQDILDYLGGEDGFMRRLRRAFQDKNIVIRDVEERLGVTDKEESVYYAKDRAFGKNEHELTVLQKQEVDPIVEKIHKSGGDLGLFSAYLYARHSGERNAALKASRGVENGSGMTEEQADTIFKAVDRLGLRAAFEDAAKDVWAMNRKYLQRRVDSGRMTQADYDFYTQKYKHYVPLRTDMTDEELDIFNSTTGGWKRNELMTAQGRKSAADDPLAFSIVQNEQAIRASNANEVRRRLAGLVRRSKGALGEVVDGVNKGGAKWSFTFGDGETVETGSPMRLASERDDIVLFKENGQLKAVKVNPGEHGRGLDLARAVTDKDVAQFNRHLEWIPRATRWMSAMRTQYVPTFIVRNMKADNLEVMLNALSERGVKDGAKFFGRFLKNEVSVVKGVKEYFKTGKSSDRFVQEAMENGLLTGGGMSSEGFTETAERLSDTLQALRERPNVLGGSIKAAKDTISLLNACAEYNTRMGVYKTLREEGVSVEDAVSYARDVTVNFNRKGYLTPYTNAAFMFSNAAIQGMGRAFKSMNSEHGKEVLAGLFLVGVAQALLDDWLGHDDDDKSGGADSRNLTEYDKSHSLGVALPTGHRFKTGIRNPWALPMYAGRKTVELLKGITSGKQAMKDLASEVGQFVTEPVGGNGFDSTSEFLQTIFPTIIDPFVQWGTGKDYRGQDRLKKNFDKYAPDSWNGKDSTPEAYKAIAKALNFISGGSEHRKGAFDVAPENVRLLTETVFGGVLTDLNNLIKGGEHAVDAVRGKPAVQVARDIPFLRDTFTNMPDNTSRFYAALDAYNADKAEFKKTTPGRRREMKAGKPYLFIGKSLLDGRIERVKELRHLERGEVKVGRKWVEPRVPRSEAQKEAFRKRRLYLQALVLNTLGG